MINWFNPSRKTLCFDAHDVSFLLLTTFLPNLGRIENETKNVNKLVISVNNSVYIVR